MTTVFGIALSALIGVSLGFFGGGGSILTVPLLVYVFGLEPKQAIASSLLIVGIASISGAVQHWRAGNARPRAGAAFGAAGMLGAYLGGRAGALIDGGILLLLFGATMVVTALAMWRGRRAATPAEDAEPALHKLAAQGLAVGTFTGLVGAGGGFLIVPALVLWAGLPMGAAVGTSLMIIVLNTVAGFAGYASHVSVDYTLIAAVAGSAVLGSFVGSRLAHVVDPFALRRAFAGFVLVMAFLILGREGALLAETLGSSLPTTGPQLVFAVAMLLVGIMAGRVTRGPQAPTYADLSYDEGGGI